MDVTVSPRARRVLWLGFWALVFVLYAPIAVLVLFSVNDDAIPAFPFAGFTTKWYERFLHNGELLDSLATSAVVGVIVAVLSVTLGLLASVALSRRRFRGRALVSALIFSPLIIPYVVLGIALLVLFRFFTVELSIATVVAGHVILALPFVVLILGPRLERIPVELEEAARDLGATGLETFRLVTFPLLAPATISAFLIAFTISFDEYAVASFLVGERPTFPVYLFGQLRFPQQLPQVIAVAVVVMAVSLLVILIAELVRRGGERRLELRGGDEG